MRFINLIGSEFTTMVQLRSMSRFLLKMTAIIHYYNESSRPTGFSCPQVTIHVPFKSYETQ